MERKLLQGSQGPSVCFEDLFGFLFDGCTRSLYRYFIGAYRDMMNNNGEANGEEHGNMPKSGKEH